MNPNYDTIIYELETQVARIQSELAEKDKLYSDLLFRYDERSKGLSYYQKLSINLQSELTELKDKVDKLREKDLDNGTEILNLMTQLTELKGKHKGDVIKTYIHCKEQRFGNYDLRQISFDAEQYYNETHKTK